MKNSVDDVVGSGLPESESSNAAALEICDYCGIDQNDSERVATIISKHFPRPGSESSISSKRFAFSPQCDLALGGYCDDGEHSNCSRPDTCKCVCHRLSAVNEIRERRRKMYFASGRPTDGWEHVDTLLGIIDSLKTERDLAIAHDRQPYPTADAYEKVCAALQKHKDDASNMKAVIIKRVREKAGYLDEQANSLVGQSNAYWAGDRRMEARLLTELATELEAVELDDLEVK